MATHETISSFRFERLDTEAPKGDSAISGPGRDITQDVESRHADAHSALQEELSKIREAARREAYTLGHTEGLETGKKLGREEGYAAGREEGYRDGLKEAQSAAQLLREAAQQWAGIEAQVADFFERAVLQLTLAVSRQVIRRDLAKETADDLRARLQGLVDALRLDNLLVTFALHPDQVTLLRQHLHALPDSWNLHPDARMELGGVRVRVQWPEGFDGVVAAQEWDARIETRWSEVVSRILEGGG